MFHQKKHISTADRIKKDLQKLSKIQVSSPYPKGDITSSITNKQERAKSFNDQSDATFPPCDLIESHKNKLLLSARTHQGIENNQSGSFTNSTILFVFLAFTLITLSAYLIKLFNQFSPSL